jgi:hypothetical protein
MAAARIDTVISWQKRGIVQGSDQQKLYFEFGYHRGSPDRHD